jgi:hypothetical protein
MSLVIFLFKAWQPQIRAAVAAAAAHAAGAAATATALAATALAATAKPLRQEACQHLAEAAAQQH